MLLGENGAGKSTLMKILSGACARDAGEIRIDGRRSPLRSPRDAQALGISTIYQEFNLVPHLSAAENIFLGREPSRVRRHRSRAARRRERPRCSRRSARAIDPARAVCGRSASPSSRWSRWPRRCRSTRRILIMDEPTSALTESEIDQLFAAIAGLTARGVSVIYISHRLEELARDRPPRDRACATAVRRDAAASRADPGARAADGRPRRRRALSRAGRGARGDELLRVERVSRGSRLRDVSLTLHRGEILGVAGLLGAGRTELARVIAGADRPESGRVVLERAAAALRATVGRDSRRGRPRAGGPQAQGLVLDARAWPPTCRSRSCRRLCRAA